MIAGELRVCSLLFQAPAPIELQPLPDLGDERSLGAVDAEVLAVGVEEDGAGDARVEELDLHVVPVLAIDRAIPLEVPAEQLPVGLPAELVVVELVGRVRLLNDELIDPVGTRSVVGAGIVEAARTEGPART